MRAARSAYAALGLTLTGAVVLATGFVALAGSLIAFGGATEDVTRHNGVALSDPAHLRFFIDHRSHAVDQAARLLTNAGMAAVIVLVAAAAATLFWYRGLRVGIAIAPLVSVAAAGVAVAGTKALVARSRPPVSLHLVTENDASFPSGHATNSAAMFLTIAFVAVLYLLRKPVARTVTLLAAALLSGLVGLSRLVLGVHWPSDVLAGWALGMSIAVAVTIAMSLLTRFTPSGRPGAADRWRARTARRVTGVLALERRPARQTLEAA
jgi:undecaprenyl-diphosphatase